MHIIIGESGGIQEVIRQVSLVAPTDATVLIQGETGTGKEMIASAIHKLSSRRPYPLIKLNCAAIPSGLLESELFGHQRGAFTGALSQRIGPFELVDKGTLFLDEVGDLPAELQSKLLRVLQEQEFDRLGSGRAVRTNVRIVAAANRDLAGMFAEGRFRADLFYRLTIFSLILLPLRDRPEDVPLLVWHFVDRYAHRMNKHIETIPQSVMHATERYSWPGNVRELQNVVQRAVILPR